MSQQSAVKTSTLVAISVGTVVTGLLAYAVYFDNKRRNDPEFRKALKKESKRIQRAAKEEAEHQGAEQKKAIRDAVALANEEGFPKDPEEVEAYFMQEVAQGEGMVQKGADNVEAALCFYRALKVYPNPRELINIYDKTVPKPVLDILAEMIAVDTSIPVGGSKTPSESGSAGDLE
ncbi:mitochondrial import receptor subunit tom20 [Ascochyta rabiei]|uniref:Mitochondrial import receptor subunit TOM20 n=1 Tax=Didymella rabiei TaxID=5454 RepID=A0A163IQF5_DIDRA|nr:mitochondrial import receptor subunit tom20 [Ascochyta rabiei]KZM25882.1 protein targeting [Ascochyta rabiei]UPX18870.1 mitochondrial import receptor subunit tom20 [Ascochyta rabiei]